MESFLICEDESPVGFIVVSVPPHFMDAYCVQHLFVLNGHRRKGIATAAVTKVFRRFRGAYRVGQPFEHEPSIEFWKTVYDSPIAVFNEYMTRAVFLLWAEDNYPTETFEPSIDWIVHDAQGRVQPSAEVAYVVDRADPPILVSRIPHVVGPGRGSFGQPRSWPSHSSHHVSAVPRRDAAARAVQRATGHRLQDPETASRPARRPRRVARDARRTTSVP